MDEVNSLNFEEDILKLKNLLIINKPNITIFTRDNSFVEFIVNIIDVMSSNIRDAINEKEIIILEGMKSKINRYLNTLEESVSMRIIDYNLFIFLKEFNQLIENWLEMIEELDLKEKASISIEEFLKYKEKINLIYEVLDMSLSVDNITRVTENLIKKASSIIAGVPTSFKISEHFLKALNYKRDNK